MMTMSGRGFSNTFETSCVSRKTRVVAHYCSAKRYFGLNVCATVSQGQINSSDVPCGCKRKRNDARGVVHNVA